MNKIIKSVRNHPEPSEIENMDISDVCQLFNEVVNYFTDAAISFDVKYKSEDDIAKMLNIYYICRKRIEQNG